MSSASSSSSASAAVSASTEAKILLSEHEQQVSDLRSERDSYHITVIILAIILGLALVGIVGYIVFKRLKAPKNFFKDIDDDLENPAKSRPRRGGPGYKHSHDLWKNESVELTNALFDMDHDGLHDQSNPSDIRTFTQSNDSEDPPLISDEIPISLERTSADMEETVTQISTRAKVTPVDPPKLPTEPAKTPSEQVETQKELEKPPTEQVELPAEQVEAPTSSEQTE